MKKLYLIGIVIVVLLVLILSLPQIGALCSWYTPVSTSTNPSFVLLQAAGLGVVLGGLLTLYWKHPAEEQEDEEGEIGSGGGDVTRMESEDDADKKE